MADSVVITFAAHKDNDREYRLVADSPMTAHIVGAALLAAGRVIKEVTRVVEPSPPRPVPPV